MEEGCLPQVIWQWLWLQGFFSNCSVFSRTAFCRKLGVFDFGNVQDLTFWQCSCSGLLLLCPDSSRNPRLHLSLWGEGPACSFVVATISRSSQQLRKKLFQSTCRKSLYANQNHLLLLSFAPVLLWIKKKIKIKIKNFADVPLFVFIHGKAHWC